MSKTNLIKTIQNEIDALNWRIDLKIIHGRPYKNDSRRHKMLVSQLRSLSSSSNWLGRATQVAAMFTL